MPKPISTHRTGRSPRQRARALDRRLAILKAAGVAFRRHGFHRTGMRQIARQAHLSPANLYYYFRGKDELLEFCQDQSLNRMLKAIRSIRRSGRSSGEQLNEAIRQQVICMLDDLGGATAHIHVDALPPRSRARIIRKRDRYEMELRALLQDGMGTGEFVPHDSVLAARAILGAINWTAHWYDQTGNRSPSDVAEHFCRLLGHGLRPQREKGLSS